MLRSWGRWFGWQTGRDYKGRWSRPVLGFTLRLEGLHERAVPGSAAAGVLGTCMTGPPAQVSSFDEYDPFGGAPGGVTL